MERADITKTLNNFSPIGLEEMDSVILMNRIDSKYVFSINKLNGILESAIEHYHILQIDENREFPYSTIYLDSPDFIFYYQHVNGKLPRYKIRYRLYEHNNQSFLEVKSKTSKNSTIKQRICYTPSEEALDQTGLSFLRTLVPIDASNLRPVLTSRFVRLTLVGLKTSERITIDYNLSFNNNSGKSIEIPSIAITELKKEQFTGQSLFARLIKEFKVRKTGFSKYCIGMSLLYNLPKQNTLKSKFLLIDKIERNG